MNQIYEGKAKIIFETDVPGQILHKFKDDATAFDGKKKGQITGKGQINAAMSSILFEWLEKKRIRTHFIEFISPDSILSHALEMIPVEVVVRNVVAGSLAKRTGLPEGSDLSTALVEFYLKDDSLGDPMLCVDHLRELNITSMSNIQEMRHQAIEINSVLLELFRDCGLKLVDFKLEFGKRGKAILLADEISPDTCRLWDMKTLEKMDKDRFRRDLGNVEEAYVEVFRRVKERVDAG